MKITRRQLRRIILEEIITSKTNDDENINEIVGIFDAITGALGGFFGGLGSFVGGIWDVALNHAADQAEAAAKAGMQEVDPNNKKNLKELDPTKNEEDRKLWAAGIIGALSHSADEFKSYTTVFFSEKA